MVTTPADLHENFIKLLDAGTARKYAHGVALQRDMYDTGVAQDVATTAFGRDLTKDQIDFGQQLQRDAAQRQFTHEENKLINLDYKQATQKRGRAGHVTPNVGRIDGGGGKYTPQYAMQHLTSRGVPPIVAAGIIGNIDAESGWDPNVFEGRRRGDNGSAAYAGQWRHDRQAHLIEFARGNGHAQPTFEDQLEFFIVEAQSGRDPQATAAIRLAAQAKTPEDAANAIMTLYERPADASTLPQRQAAARNIFNTMSPGMSSAPAALPGSAADAMMAPPPDAQRRYTDPSAAPVAEETVPVSNGGMQQEVAWTDQDFVDNNISPWYRNAIPPEFEVVGNDFFSGAQLDIMDPALKTFLFPVGGILPDETQEYLLLRPKEGVQIGPNGTPLPNGGVDNAIGGTPAPVAAPPPPQPDITQTAAQVPQNVDSTYRPNAGPSGPIQQPAMTTPMTGNVPTGKKTRRNEAGQLELLVGDQWVTTGG